MGGCKYIHSIYHIKYFVCEIKKLASSGNCGWLRNGWCFDWKPITQHTNIPINLQWNTLRRNGTSIENKSVCATKKTQNSKTMKRFSQVRDWTSIPQFFGNAKSKLKVKLPGKSYLKHSGSSNILKPKIPSYLTVCVITFVLVYYHEVRSKNSLSKNEHTHAHRQENRAGTRCIGKGRKLKIVGLLPQLGLHMETSKRETNQESCQYHCG